MKINTKILISALGVMAFSLSGCFLFSSTKIDTIDKTETTFTYKDYMEHNVYYLDNTPLKGSPKLLVLPIWFTDSSYYISNRNQVRDDIGAAYFGTNQETGWRSVSTYYEEESNGKLKLQGTLSEWIEPGVSSSSFYENMNYTTSLVVWATDYFFNNHPEEDRRDYDLDSNGYLDGVILIYAAPDYQVAGTGSNMWAYCYWLQSLVTPSVSSPQPNVFFWASYDFMYGANDGQTYHNGETTYCNIDTHTFIHEMGHVLGLQDYYDYTNQTKPAAGFSMQDYNVGAHDPYSVMAYGWANVYAPTKSCTLELHNFQETNEVILLKNTPFEGSPFDEYLLLELYTPTGLNEFDVEHNYKPGYPKGPDVPGIRLWHVDARLAYTFYKEYEYFSASQISNEIIDGRYYYHGLSNTRSGNGHASVLGGTYTKYNLLQLIRNDKKASYTASNTLTQSHLFRAGSRFTPDTFKKQFVNATKFNDKEAIKWSFTVKSVSYGKAVIKLVKSK